MVIHTKKCLQKSFTVTPHLLLGVRNCQQLGPQSHLTDVSLLSFHYASLLRFERLKMAVFVDETIEMKFSNIR